MTANKNEQGSEPGRPAWATGLDLSPQAIRPTDETIKAWMWGQELVLRRLADAEIRVAELEKMVGNIEGPHGSRLCDCADIGDPEPPVSPRSGRVIAHHCDCRAVMAAAALLGSESLTAHAAECGSSAHGVSQ